MKNKAIKILTALVFLAITFDWPVTIGAKPTARLVKSCSKEFFNHNEKIAPYATQKTVRNAKHELSKDSKVCDFCNGSGYFNNHTCNKCNGTGQY